MASSKSLLVAAIDFGTTYSGVAFSMKDEFDSDPLKVSAKHWAGGQLVSLKGPTCILIDNDGETVDSFGYEAETKYAELAGNEEHKQWYFFRRFKMVLFGEIGVKKNILLEDESGRKLPARKVFSLAIGYLMADLHKMSNDRLAGGGIAKDDVHWVLTVPAIWNDAAKQFMREAAEDAGIKGDHLTIALDPEAASMYCRHLPLDRWTGTDKFSLTEFQPGSKYVLLDDGGGTVDVAVHEITRAGDIRELHQPSGGNWGSTQIDKAYEELLSELVGNSTMKKFKEVNMEDYIDLFQDFEIRKRSITPEKGGKILCKIPMALVDMYKEVTGKVLKDSIGSTKSTNQVSVTGDKLRIDADVMKRLFARPVQSIVKHVRDLLQVQAVKGCSVIVLVGGFSESPILQNEIRRAFPQMKVIVPIEAGLAVLKGAVIFGHSPRAIAERVCKYTYGIDTTHSYRNSCTHRQGRCELDENGELRCYDIFSMHAKVGQTVRFGEEQEERIYTPITEDQTSMDINVYASSYPDPQLITEKGCNFIGKCTIPMPDTTGGRERKIGVTFIFGGTEIEVKIVNKRNGIIKRIRVDFLG